MQSAPQRSSCPVLPGPCPRGWSWWAARCEGLGPGAGATPGWGVGSRSAGSSLEGGLRQGPAAWGWRRQALAAEAVWRLFLGGSGSVWFLQGHLGGVSCGTGAPQAGSGVLGQCGGCFGGSPAVGERQATASSGRFLGPPAVWAAPGGPQQRKGWLGQAPGCPRQRDQAGSRGLRQHRGQLGWALGDDPIPRREHPGIIGAQAVVAAAALRRRAARSRLCRSTG